MGLCIIGDHEPCFSVSSFFSKNDDTYKSQYEKFSSLLADLKAKVEEAEKQPTEGGEHQMENVVNPEVNEPTPAQEFEQVEEPVSQEPEAPAAEEFVEELPLVDPEAQEEPVEEEPAAEEPAEEPEGEEAEEAEEPAAEPAVDFEAQIAELQNQLTEMTTNYENAQTRIAELEA